MKLSFCLETFYTDLPFNDRLECAKADGVEHIEFWEWRDKNSHALNNAILRSGLHISNFSGNRRFGMIDPTDVDLFLVEILQSARFAQQMNCPRIMLLTQPLFADGRAKAVSAQAHERSFDLLVDTCRKAAQVADETGIDLVLEPLNDRDHPDYFLQTSKDGFAVIEAVNHPKLRLLYDVYHMAMMGIDVVPDVEAHLPLIGYFHFADLPYRTEPGSGILPYDALMNMLHRAGYDGTIGFECFSAPDAGPDLIPNLLHRFKLNHEEKRPC
jgi:hydroxypyruvate isomerase